MAENSRECIVCATRGGEGSRAVQLRAIQKAKETGKRLIFLYIVDPTSLGEHKANLVEAIHEELYWMGQTLLRIAKHRAEVEDVEAEIVFREGAVRAEIKQFLTETKADLLMLGAPRGTTSNVFGDDAVEQFASELEEMTETPVQVVRPESVERA